MKILTVDDLYKALGQARKDGLGKRRIMVSDDDEGNGYHQLFEGVFLIPEDMFGDAYSPRSPYGVTPEEAVNDYVIIC